MLFDDSRVTDFCHCGHGIGQTNDGNDQGCGRERKEVLGYGLPASFDEGPMLMRQEYDCHGTFLSSQDY
jgi:hypothetical protein